MLVQLVFVSKRGLWWYYLQCVERRSISRLGLHYSDVIMSAMTSRITSITIVSQIKENIKAPRHWHLCGGIHRWPVNSTHKGPITRKMFPFWWRHYVRVSACVWSVSVSCLCFCLSVCLCLCLFVCLSLSLARALPLSLYIHTYMFPLSSPLSYLYLHMWVMCVSV